MCGCPYSTKVLLFGCLYLQRSNEWYRLLMSLILDVDPVLSSPACICRRRKSFPRGLQMCKAFSLFFVVFKLTSWSFTIKQKISCMYIQLYVRGEEREKGREKEVTYAKCYVIQRLQRWSLFHSCWQTSYPYFWCLFSILWCPGITSHSFFGGIQICPLSPGSRTLMYHFDQLQPPFPSLL